MFLISLHLPHARREDCIQVWEQITASDLDVQLACCRYHDAVCIGADLNLEDFRDTSQDERRVHLEDLLLNHALSISHPQEPTWQNSTRGASSALDYLMYRAPDARLVDTVLTGPETILGSDHKPVWGDMISLFPMHRAKRVAWTHWCGKWTVDGARLLHAFKYLAEKLELDAHDFSDAQCVLTCNPYACRSGSLRYRDSPELLALVKARRQLSGREARDAAVRILSARKRPKRPGCKTCLIKRLPVISGRLDTFEHVRSRLIRNCMDMLCTQAVSTRRCPIYGSSTEGSSLERTHMTHGM